MITLDSTIQQVYAHPIGKDILDMLLAQTGKSPKLIDNPLVGSLKLSAAEKLLGKRGNGVAQMIVNVLGYHPEMPPESPPAITRKWWKEAVVYQIYPRSFQDSDGDGVGDLAGIRQRIPYLKALGVDMVWLSPIYDSPNDDNGYDIRNYRKIMKEFGSMASFNALLKELHNNGIKLIMDLVVNHTSDEHEWFQQALKNPQSPTKDYYIWAKGKNGGPPNNWNSIFAGPAWNYYEETGEWALHLFSKKQMDLNWENPALRAEVYDMVNWWLDKGVDGFRLDVITFISKDGLADGNEALGGVMGARGVEHYFYGPRLHEYLQELRHETFTKHGAFTVGETPAMGMEMCKLLTAEEREELDVVFNFDHLENPGKSREVPYQYDLTQLKPHILKWQTGYGNNCWQSLFFENHDNPRMPSKINPDDAYCEVIAKLLAVLQFTQRGTPFIYQGQELGMTNTMFNSLEEMRDVESLNRYRELCETMPKEAAFAQIAGGSRDHARTPMQWSGEENAGFSSAAPWIGVNPNYTTINAEAQMKNPNSVYHFFKNLIALRRSSEALLYGQFAPVFVSEKNTLCYFRIAEGDKYYIEVNLTGQEQRRPGPISGDHVLMAGNYGGVVDTLRPYEANVYRVGGGVSL